MFLFGAVFYMRDGDYRSCVYLQEYKRNFADKRLKCRAKPWLYGDWMAWKSEARRAPHHSYTAQTPAAAAFETAEQEEGMLTKFRTNLLI